jgi:hypothetical protein
MKNAFRDRTASEKRSQSAKPPLSPEWHDGHSLTVAFQRRGHLLLDRFIGKASQIDCTLPGKKLQQMKRADAVSLVRRIGHAVHQIEDVWSQGLMHPRCPNCSAKRVIPSPGCWETRVRGEWRR